MRQILLFIATALPAAAQSSPYNPTMSGEQFVKMMNPAPQTELEYRNRDKAYSYVDGMLDSTQGRLWCQPHQLKTPDLALELAGAVAKLSAEERKKSAADLLLGELQRQYPCGNGGAR